MSMNKLKEGVKRNINLYMKIVYRTKTFRNIVHKGKVKMNFHLIKNYKEVVHS